MRAKKSLAMLAAASVVFFMCATSTPASAADPPGMVAKWQFEEGSGSVIHSSVGSYDGQVNGATWSPGKVGGSLAFDGIDDYVAFETNDFLNTSSSFSYSVWLEFDDLGNGTCEEGEDFAAYEQMVISVHEGPYLYLASTGRLVSMVDTTSSAGPYGTWRLVTTDTCSWSVGTWHHVAVTLDGAAMSLYVDGVLADQEAGGEKVPSGYVGAGGYPQLGKMHYEDQYYLDGAMDELAVFDRALSVDEVVEISDVTPPTITVTTPPIPPATYTQNQVVLADFVCADAESGIASCEGSIAWGNESVPMVDGQPLDTSRLSTVVGPNASWTVVATDNAGNTWGVHGGYYVADPEPFTGRFVVNISTNPDGQDQYMNGWGWKHGPVTIYLGDGWGNPIGTAPIGGDAGEGGFFSMVDPGTFGPGDTVKVMDAVGNFRSLSVANLAVTSIDPLTGDVAGTCDVGMDVNLEYSTSDEYPNPMQLVAECVGGVFEESFEPDELPNFPAGSELSDCCSYVEARQFDDDGDGTQVDAWYAYPSGPIVPGANIGVNIATDQDGLGQYIGGAGWSNPAPGWFWTDPVTMTINGGNPVVIPIDPTHRAWFTVWVDAGTFKPGDLVRITDGTGAYEEHTVANLSITTIDLHTGRVAGTCDVGMDVYLELATDATHEDPAKRTATCIGGAFEGFFTSAELQEYPGGSFVEARQYDVLPPWAADTTQVDEYYFYSPFEGIFSVNLSDGEQYMGGAGWGGPVTVTVDGVEVLTDYPYMYSDDCSPGGTPRPLCFDTWGRFPLGGFVFEPGQHVVVSDGVNQKDLVLADVSITTIDVPTGRVTGTCSVGLDVLLTDIGENLNFACDDGTFERFFEPYLGWSSHVKVVQRDDDGDWTKYETAFFYDEDGSFDGFLSPVNNDEWNKAKAGRPIPVKWLLLDGDGVPVSHPASFFNITSSGAACEGGEPTDAIEEYVGGSGIQYLGDGYWQFNWKTPKSYAGQCRTMTLTLLDGSNLTASFMFK